MNTFEKAKQALANRPQKGLERWFSTYKFTLASGILTVSQEYSLFKGKRGDTAQGYSGGEFTQAKTNMGIERLLPYPALVRHLGVRFFMPELVEKASTAIELIGSGMYLDFLRGENKHLNLGTPLDYLHGPSMGAAVAREPAASAVRTTHIQRFALGPDLPPELLKAIVLDCPAEPFEVVAQVPKAIDLGTSGSETFEMRIDMLVEPLGDVDGCCC